MSPRPYQSDKRRAAADETRRRVLAAARALLAGDEPRPPSLDAVAKAADVSRQTVYNAFGSKPGLLEALFDALAADAGMDLAPAFTASSRRAALAEFTRVFCGFWASEPVVIGRLRGMAVLDAELDRLLRERDEMRRTALRALLPDAPDDRLDAVWQLTSFESYAALAATRTPAETADALADAAAALAAAD